MFNPNFTTVAPTRARIERVRAQREVSRYRNVWVPALLLTLAALVAAWSLDGSDLYRLTPAQAERLYGR